MFSEAETCLDQKKGDLKTLVPLILQGIRDSLYNNNLLFHSGPQDDPEKCGTPVLCLFYGLLLFIIFLTIYTTIKGSTQ